MLRRGKRIVRRVADDASNSSLAVGHSDSEPMQITNSNVTLESTVFGGESRITEQLENFEVVTSGFKRKKTIEHRSRPTKPTPQPVWTNDDPSLISELSRKILKTPAKWAQLPSQRSDSGEDSESASGDDDDDDDDGGDDSKVDSSTGNCLASTSQLVHLPEAHLQFRKCRDVNADRPAKGKLRSVEFHHSAQIMLTAGMDQTLRDRKSTRLNSSH